MGDDHDAWMEELRADTRDLLEERNSHGGREDYPRGAAPTAANAKVLGYYMDGGCRYLIFPDNLEMETERARSKGVEIVWIRTKEDRT